MIFLSNTLNAGLTSMGEGIEKRGVKQRMTTGIQITNFAFFKLVNNNHRITRSICPCHSCPSVTVKYSNECEKPKHESISFVTVVSHEPDLIQYIDPPQKSQKREAT